MSTAWSVLSFVVCSTIAFFCCMFHHCVFSIKVLVYFVKKKKYIVTQQLHEQRSSAAAAAAAQATQTSSRSASRTGNIVKKVVAPTLSNPDSLTIAEFRDWKVRLRDFMDLNDGGNELRHPASLHAFLRSRLDTGWTRLWTAGRLGISSGDDFDTFLEKMLGQDILPGCWSYTTSRSDLGVYFLPLSPLCFFFPFKNATIRTDIFGIEICRLSIWHFVKRTPGFPDSRYRLPCQMCTEYQTFPHPQHSTAKGLL